MFSIATQGNALLRLSRCSQPTQRRKRNLVPVPLRCLSASWARSPDQTAQRHISPRLKQLVICETIPIALQQNYPIGFAGAHLVEFMHRLALALGGPSPHHRRAQLPAWPAMELHPTHRPYLGFVRYTNHVEQHTQPTKPNRMRSVK
jgi:hypothetical protein